MSGISKHAKRYPALQAAFVKSSRFVRRPVLSSKRMWRKRREQKLTRALSSLGPDVFFVQVGSNDGKRGDPLFEHTKADGWRGIAIEPVPHLFERLQKNHRGSEGIECLNLAIAPDGNRLKFYTVPEDIEALVGRKLPNWADQLSSFKRENLEKHLDGILIPHIIELDVQCATLGELIGERGLTCIDVLHIDAEGFDFEVFQTFPFPRFTPKIIIIEHKHMVQENLRLLLSELKRHGYRNHLLSQDLLAVRRK